MFRGGKGLILINFCLRNLQFLYSQIYTYKSLYKSIKRQTYSNPGLLIHGGRVHLFDAIIISYGSVKIYVITWFFVLF